MEKKLSPFVRTPIRPITKRPLPGFFRFASSCLSDATFLLIQKKPPYPPRISGLFSISPEINHCEGNHFEIIEFMPISSFDDVVPIERKCKAWECRPARISGTGWIPTNLCHEDNQPQWTLCSALPSSLYRSLCRDTRRSSLGSYAHSPP